VDRARNVRSSADEEETVVTDLVHAILVYGAELVFDAVVGKGPDGELTARSRKIEVNCCGVENQVRDRRGVRHDRQVARVELYCLCSHTSSEEPLEIR